MSDRPYAGARAGSTTATLLHQGRRIVMDADGLTIGRQPDNDVTIAHSSVSRHHARIAPVEGGYWIVDLGSRNGTQLNGERFRGESRWLGNGDTVVDRRRDAALPDRPGDALRGRAAGDPAHRVHLVLRRAAADRARRRERRRPRRPERVAHARRGRPPRRQHRAARPHVAQRHARRRAAHAPRRAAARVRDRHRAVLAHLRRRGLRRPRRAGRAAARRRGHRRPRQGQADPRADVAVDRARRADRDHRRERRRQVDADEVARGRRGGDRRHDHDQRRAALQPAHRHRLPPAGRGRPRRPHGLRGARLRRTPAPAARHDARRDRGDGRPRARGARARAARPHAHRLALGRPAQARRARRRAAQPAEPALPRRADDGARSRARGADDGPAEGARRPLARRGGGHARHQEPRLLLAHRRHGPRRAHVLPGAAVRGARVLRRRQLRRHLRPARPPPVGGVAAQARGGGPRPAGRPRGAAGARRGAGDGAAAAAACARSCRSSSPAT